MSLRTPVSVALVAVVLTLAPVQPSPARHDWAGPIQERYWLGEDGNPLPFRSDDEIEEFLRTADVVGSEDISVGITDPLRVTLEKDGVRADAIFRYVDEFHQRTRLRNGRLYLNFRDSCHFEPAAYEMARLLGMDNVPPAVKRRIGPRSGTLQIWVHHAMTEGERVERRMSPPNRLRWTRQMHRMLLFDALIGNEDRNAGNILIDGNWSVWLIDHTRAFYQRHRYQGLEDVAYVNEEFWVGMRALDEQTLESAVGEYLSSGQIARMLERRDQLVERIELLIAENGADAVLYR